MKAKHKIAHKLFGERHDEQLVRWATYASTSAAIFLISIKLYAYLVTRSLSLQATLIDSLLDGLASLINMIAVYHALRPADAEHRFGHGKAESLAALGQSIFIFASAGWLLWESIHHLLNPQSVGHNVLGIWVMAISIGVTSLLVWFQSYVITRSSSAAIGADSLHYRTDLLINFSVIVSLVLTSYFGLFAIDSLFAMGIALYIIISSWHITQQAIDVLMDRELADEDRKLIQKVALSHPKVLGTHELRTRSSGARQFIQLHLELPESMTLGEAHIVSEEVEEALLAKFPLAEILIHQDCVKDTCRNRL